jgi:hypothetical protein
VKQKDNKGMQGDSICQRCGKPGELKRTPVFMGRCVPLEAGVCWPVGCVPRRWCEACRQATEQKSGWWRRKERDDGSRA